MFNKKLINIKKRGVDWSNNNNITIIIIIIIINILMKYSIWRKKLFHWRDVQVTSCLFDRDLTVKFSSHLWHFVQLENIFKLHNVGLESKTTSTVDTNSTESAASF
jgi:hypothetical protein